MSIHPLGGCDPQSRSHPAHATTEGKKGGKEGKRVEEGKKEGEGRKEMGEMKKRKEWILTTLLLLLLLF